MIKSFILLSFILVSSVILASKPKPIIINRDSINRYTTIVQTKSFVYVHTKSLVISEILDYDKQYKSKLQTDTENVFCYRKIKYSKISKKFDFLTK